MIPGMPPKASQPDASDDLMTAVDAARILGLSVDMVRRLAKDGHLPFMATIRGVRLFRRGNVEQLAHQRALRKDPPLRVNSKAGESLATATLNLSRRAR
jgi:excisionase family DNA binding protein